MNEFIISLLRKIAMAAAVLAVILCVLILVNYLQVKRADPLNSAAMKTLVNRMQASPGDEQLRQEIRELDLLARKVFFTSQWQVRVGGYLLFFSLLAAVTCLKTIELLKRKIPGVPPGEHRDFWLNRKVNLNWVIYTGISMVILSLVVVFLTHRELGIQIEQAAIAAGKQAGSSEEETGRQTTGMQDAGMQDAGMKGAGREDTAGKSDSVTGSIALAAEGYPSVEEIRRNFPSFRGPDGIGIAWQKNIPVDWDGKTGKNIRWKTEVPLPGYNSPVIWNDKIFLAGASEGKREVYCFSLETGKLLWRREAGTIPGSPGSPPKVIRETGFSAPTMTTDGRRAYAIFANGDIVALDFEGNLVWARNLGLPQNHYGHSSSLIMFRNLVIVQYDQRGSAGVMALDGKSGEQVWKTVRKVSISWASPILVRAGSRQELILAADPIVASYDPANGRELWQIDCISGEVGPSAAFADGVIFTVNETSKLAAIGMEGGPKILWENTDYLSDIPSPLATGNYLILATSYGTVVCYDGKTGEIYWEQDFGAPVFASPMLAEGKVFLMDKKGVMHIFRAGQSFEQVSQPSLGEGSSCTPAFADGKIVIRGDKNLYCIGK
jgi:outer membrane protein assembly factor BamB